MGREIRRVPPDWEHPKYTKENARYENWIGNYIGMYDKDYETACMEWYEEAARFVPTEFSRFYHEYADDPPDELHYRTRKWTPEEATHYQVYETVSEGTPVTPHFATKEELINYLVENGDFWDQERRNGGWSYDGAKKFVESKWAPSMVVIKTKESIEIKEPRDGI